MKIRAYAAAHTLRRRDREPRRNHRLRDLLVRLDSPGTDSGECCGKRLTPWRQGPCPAQGASELGKSSAVRFRSLWGLVLHHPSVGAVSRLASRAGQDGAGVGRQTKTRGDVRLAFSRVPPCTPVSGRSLGRLPHRHGWNDTVTGSACHCLKPAIVAQPAFLVTPTESTAAVPWHPASHVERRVRARQRESPARVVVPSRASPWRINCHYPGCVCPPHR